MKKKLKPLETMREAVIVLLLISIVLDLYDIVFSGIFDIFIYPLLALLFYAFYLMFLQKKEGTPVQVIYGVAVFLINFPRLINDFYKINFISYLLITFLGLSLFLFNCYLMINVYQDEFQEFASRWIPRRFHK